MILEVKKSILNGRIEIASSKSHTIRAIILASLSEGKSVIKNSLYSEDTLSCVNACKALGADIQIDKDWIIKGFDGLPQPRDTKIDVGNSGTTLRLIASVASLGTEKIVIDGDISTRTRPIKPLLDSLMDLGVETSSSDDKCPISVKGRINGGKTTIKCTTSQYLSSLLISCPLADKDTEIIVEELNEKSYVRMTLDWLDNQDIRYEEKNLEKFIIKGGQKYKPFTITIPGDFSSATFPICAGVMCGKDVVIKGLDMNDSQGDKAIINILKKMGADITINNDELIVNKSALKGMEIDLNDIPDALPALSVIGCYAEGTTILKNVPQARFKETDRIAVMTKELKKMGAYIEELEDGLIVKHSKLKGSSLNGYDDHRIVMALSLAGLIADGKTRIDSAESINITFPNYDKLMRSIGGYMKLENQEE